MDFPDSALETLDPRELEDTVTRVALDVEPQVIISYPPHGISGFIDHLITHEMFADIGLRAYGRFVPNIQFSKQLDSW